MSTTQTSRKEYPLRKQESTSSKRSARKRDGTLQKLGGFFQSSPTIIHSKGLYRINNNSVFWALCNGLFLLWSVNVYVIKGHVCHVK